MFGLLIAGASAFAGVAVLGLVWAVVALLCWVFVLPFKLLALAFRGVALILLAPFLLLIGILAALCLGVGMLAFLAPALPIVALVWFAWWLVHRRHEPHAAGF